jgi:hypothetical protein
MRSVIREYTHAFVLCYLEAFLHVETRLEACTTLAAKLGPLEVEPGIYVDDIVSYEDRFQMVCCAVEELVKAVSSHTLQA